MSGLIRVTVCVVGATLDSDRIEGGYAKSAKQYLGFSWTNTAGSGHTGLRIFTLTFFP